MFNNILRFITERKVKSLIFTNENVEYIDNNVNEVGLYVHVPFCKTLCSFCPYYKEKYDAVLAQKYKNALIKEIKSIGGHYKDKVVTSIYFGGGTPSLLLGYLEEILSTIREIFKVNCEIGIELHPRDVTRKLLSKLKLIGFTMVSLSVQSFQEKSLEILGRELINGPEVLRMIKDTGFNAIEVNLTIGLKGQSEEDLRSDFRIAFNNGATQVSAYPCVDYLDTNNKERVMKKREKKKLFSCLDELSKELNLERTSLWTFSKKDKPKYSSITRDTYIGFGASAASLTNEYFKLNTFSVEEYIKAVNDGHNPKALTMDFGEGTREMYWVFWNAYTLELNSEMFNDLFEKDIEELFGVELLWGKSLGLLSKCDTGYKLTEKGAYQYQLIEEYYMENCIDKVWGICKKDPWPKKIKI